MRRGSGGALSVLLSRRQGRGAHNLWLFLRLSAHVLLESGATLWSTANCSVCTGLSSLYSCDRYNLSGMGELNVSVCPIQII